MAAKYPGIDGNQTAGKRFTIKLSGAVQGIGFRPFIYRLAHRIGLSGWVNNTSHGVRIEVEGTEPKIDEFIRRIHIEKPAPAEIHSCDIKSGKPAGYSGFHIKDSDRSIDNNAVIVPDMATCPKCLQEVFDPDDRRYRYPFTNCTACGPRYSIIESLPYDRQNTTMSAFVMCKKCRAEYEDPHNRRFHAQPNACPECGPHLELWDASGKVMAMHDAGLIEACEAIVEGRILAIKGLGGFQLLVDAGNDEAVKELRQRKKRMVKPFALMYPDIHSVKKRCTVSLEEENLLQSTSTPIVLLGRKTDRGKNNTVVSRYVAPHNPYLGIMLPYTPLHHLIMAELNFPIVATSGNISDEPICIDEYEALSRLNGIADLFLVHNRPIARQMDDSITRIVRRRALVLRSARGYAPVTMTFHKPLPSCLAVGAHQKNSIAFSKRNHVFISQHIGDLDTVQAHNTFNRVIQSLSSIYDFRPGKTVSDMHPDYTSTKFAQKQGLPGQSVQHHHAHVLSCMADNQLEERALGVAWDGTGLGLDNTIWGGEFLKVDSGRFVRIAHLRTFRLPGGEKAVVEPRRAAMGLLFEIFKDNLLSHPEAKPFLRFDPREQRLLLKMLEKDIYSPLTSSAGRLFDAVSSILNLCQKAEFEGQAAMALEFAADDRKITDAYPFKVNYESTPYIIDWEPMIRAIIRDRNKPLSKNLIAAKFHDTLAEMIIAIAVKTGEKNILLTGGCFQNKYLLGRSIARLESCGFKPFWHRRIPPNDGGIALGQIMAISHIRKKE